MGGKTKTKGKKPAIAMDALASYTSTLQSWSIYEGNLGPKALSAVIQSANGVSLTYEDKGAREQMPQQQVKAIVKSCILLKDALEYQIAEMKKNKKDTSKAKAALEAVHGVLGRMLKPNNPTNIQMGAKQGKKEATKVQAVIAKPTAGPKDFGIPVKLVSAGTEYMVDISQVQVNDQLLAPMSTEQEAQFEGYLREGILSQVRGKNDSESGRGVLRMLAESAGMSYSDFIQGPSGWGDPSSIEYQQAASFFTGHNEEATASIINALREGDYLGALNAAGENQSPLGDTLFRFLTEAFKGIEVSMPLMVWDVGGDFVVWKKGDVSVMLTAEAYAHWCELFNPELVEAGEGQYNVDISPTGKHKLKGGGKAGIGVVKELGKATNAQVTFEIERDAYLKKGYGIIGTMHVTFYGGGKISKETEIATYDMPLYYSVGIGATTAGSFSASGELLVGISGDGPVGFFPVIRMEYINNLLRNKYDDVAQVEEHMLSVETGLQLQIETGKKATVGTEVKALWSMEGFAGGAGSVGVATKKGTFKLQLAGQKIPVPGVKPKEQPWMFTTSLKWEF